MAKRLEITSSPRNLGDALTGKWVIQNQSRRPILLHEGTGTNPTGASVVVYFGEGDSGKGIRVTISPSGTAAFDSRARGSLGNDWRIRRAIVGSGSLVASVDAENKLITVGGGPQTGATLTVALSNLTGNGITVTSAYVGGGTATDVVSAIPRDFSFSGGVDGGPADREEAFILAGLQYGKSEPSEHIYEKGSDPMWAWCDPGIAVLGALKAI